MADAKINITAVDGTKAAIEEAKRNLSSLGDKAAMLSSKMGSLGLAIGAAFSAGSLIHLVNMLDRLDDMAEKTGISVKSLSALRYAGEAVGTSQEQLATGLTKLAKLMGQAAGGNEQAVATFKALGVEFADTSGKLKGTDKVLAEISQRFAGFEDGPGKAALAMRAFGKSGEDMIPLLNLGTAGLQSMAAEAKALGAIFGADVAKNAADFNDNLHKIKMASEAAAVALTGPLVKALGDLSGAFIESKKNGENYLHMIERLASFTLKLPPILSILPGARFIQMLQQSGEALRAPATTEEIQARVNKIVLTGGAGRGFVNPKVAAPTVEDKTKPAKAPDHFADNFINQLITEYANLTGAMSKTDEVTRKLDTSTEKFTDSERARALGLAKLIDAQKNKTIVLEHEQKALQSIGDLVQAQEDAYAENLKTMREGATAQQFEITLLGKTAEVVERLRFERELALKVAGAEAQVLEQQTQGLISQIEARQRLAALSRFAGETRDAFGAIQADRRDQQFNPARGMSDAAKDYLEEIGKVGDATKRIVTGAFKGMEDALVNFVMTGKLDFKSLADSIISEMIRMQIQQSITKPLGALVQDNGGLFGLGKKIFGGFFANGGSPPVGVPSIVGENGPEIFVPNGPGTIIPNGAGFGGVTIHQPLYLTANNASAETVGQIRALMPGFLAENRRLIVGAVQQEMRIRGGRLAA